MFLVRRGHETSMNVYCYIYYNKMVKLLFARWATEFEISEFKENIESRNRAEYKKSIAYLNSRKKEISEAYHQLFDEYEKISQEKKDEYLRLIRAYRDETCTCGSKPEWIPIENGFWGCPNYRDKSTVQNHFNFIGLDYDYDQAKEFAVQKTEFNYSTWITTLKHKVGLPKSVKTHSLYEFVTEDLGLVCICENFTGESILHKLNSLKESTKRGVDFEHEFRKIAEKRHVRIHYQQAIKYQYESREFKFAIPDFIAVDHDRITIYECKINGELIDDRQRFLYESLVKFIMDEKKIDKDLFFHYVYKDENDKIIIE